MEDSRLWLYDYERCGASVPAAGDSVAHRAGGGGRRFNDASAAPQRHGVLGIDEAGRGSWVGPVVAAAAYIVPEAYLDARLRGGCALVDDSKKLSRAQREALFTQIADWRSAGLLRVEAGQAGVAEIETYNVVGATALAMRRAVEALQLPCVLPSGACVKVGGKRAQKNVLFAAPASAQSELFDFTSGGGSAAGNVSPAQAVPAARELSATAGQMVPPPYVWVDGIPMPKRLPFAHEGIVSGDGTSLAIAIASIWAKVTRDRLLTQMATEFPQYGWDGNAGYGTPAHLEALRAHGACCHHRPKFLRKQGL